ncbi:D-lactate ferricytochrome c oxidoreductase [Coemansia sp. RSA 2336]|nr:D-lactate ferricytochrome c oxidoreductase [Coemansia sp. RSA 2336]
MLLIRNASKLGRLRPAACRAACTAACKAGSAATLKAAQPALRHLVQQQRRLAHTPARNPRFKQLTSADIEQFKAMLPHETILATAAVGGSSDPAELEGFNADWLNKYRGRSQLVLRPKSTQEVAAILGYCNEHSIAVVPQGGNTGLVGGSVPVHDEVVLSLRNLNRVRGFDEVSGVLACDAGCVLEELDGYVAERGHAMPLDLGAKGSCQIGGNVATNAGGIRFLRYGSLHGSVLGLEVVLADGTVLDNMSLLRKDNTGYDLKQLFVGSEGTLGVITGVSLVTPRRPAAVNVAVLGVRSYADVQAAFRLARQRCGEILSAFEFWDASCMGAVLHHHALRSPLAAEFPFYVLVETSGSSKAHDDEKLEALLEELLETAVVEDGALAQDDAQIRKMWTMREGIPESLGKTGATYKYDVSIPIPALYDVVGDIARRLEQAGLYKPGDPARPVKLVCGYGHIGDSNLHLNIVADKFQDSVTAIFEPYVYEWVQSQRGSISAEHGIGLMKRDYLKYSKSPPMIDYMKRIKSIFDPKGILNPYKAADARLVPWVEKYRPKTIGEVAAQEQVVQVLRKSLETKNLPHLLFYGPPGTGKTSTILALTREMYGPAACKTRVLELNASDERGIAVIREKVKTFARSVVTAADKDYPSPPYKIVILDEADSMTTDAQAALRRIMEKYSRITRFCLVCNYVSRIIEPLASRCSKFRFKSLPREQAIAQVVKVARLEAIPVEEDAVEALVDCAEGDLRRAIMSLQSASRVVQGTGGKLHKQMVLEMVGLVPPPVIQRLRALWSDASCQLVQLAVSDLVLDGYPAARVLAQLHDLAMHDQQLSSLQKSKLALLMAAVDKALCDGADEELQLLDLMLQASRIAAQPA